MGLTHAAPPERFWFLARLGLVMLMVLIAVGFAGIVARDLAQSLRLLDYRYALDYGEGVVMSQVVRLEDGLSLYPATDRTGPGFVGANYPPVFYQLLALFPTDLLHLYTSGRWVSFISYLITALLAHVAVWRMTRLLPAGLVAAAIFLAMPPSREWSLFVKPDLLALALSTAGLALVTTAPRWTLLAAPIFALALLTKQTMIAAPIAVGLGLLLTPGRRRQAFLLAGLVAILVLIPLIQVELGPDEIVWHLLFANVRGWHWDRFDDLGIKFLEICLPLLAGLAVCLIMVWRSRRAEPLIIYGPLTLLTLLESGAPGSSRNYALEAGLGLALSSGLSIGYLMRLVDHQSQRRVARMATGLSLALCGLLGLQAQHLWQLPEREFGRRWPTTQVTRGYDHVLNFLSSTDDGPVLSEDPGIVVQAARQLEYYDPSLMQKMADAGSWDQQPLLEAIEARHFSVILTLVDLERSPERAGRWTPEVVAAILANYRLLYRDALMIFVPRQDG